MKKLLKVFSLILGVVLIIACIAMPVNAQTLNVGGEREMFSDGFEKDIAGWIKFNGDADGVEHSSTYAKSGTKSLLLPNHAKTWDSPAYNIRQKIQVGDNEDIITELIKGTYTVRMWVRVEGITNATTQGHLILRTTAAGAAYDFMSSPNNNGVYYSSIGSNTTINKSEWTLLTGSFMITDFYGDVGAPIYLCVDGIDGEAGAQLYIDDVQVYRLSDYYISNGDFSDGVDGWRSWGGDGLLYNGFDEENNLNYASYDMADRYSSIACNINQILNYFGSGKFDVRFNARLATDEAEEKTLHAYVSRGIHEFHNNEHNYMYLTNEWKSFGFIIDTDEVITKNNETKSLYEHLAPEDNEVHLRFQRLGSDENYAYEICNISITYYNQFTAGANEYDFGYRYVSRLGINQVNGVKIPTIMDGDKHYDRQGNNNDVYDLSRIDLICAAYESDDDIYDIDISGDRIAYGIYQLDAKEGTMDSFVEWLATKSEYSVFYNFLSKDNNYCEAEYAVNWNNCADKNAQLFRNAQYDFVKETYYDVIVAMINDEFGANYVENSSVAYKNLIFSIAIQMGPTKKTVDDIFVEAFEYKNPQSEKEKIQILCERITRTYHYGYLGVENVMTGPTITAMGLNNRWLAKFDSRPSSEQGGVLLRHFGSYFDALKMLEQEGRE